MGQAPARARRGRSRPPTRAWGGRAWPWLALALWLTAPAQPAQAFEDILRAPWNLALVVDNTAALDQPWLGSPLRPLVEAALQTELRTLPLRVKVGVWLANQQGASLFIPPASALEVKQAEVILPQPEGQDLAQAGSLGQAVGQALAWLRSQGQGSLVILCAGQAPGLEPALLGQGGPLPEEVFVHALSLGSGQGLEGLRRLTLAGGGAYQSAVRPGETSPLLHQTVLTALAATRLLVQAHDPANTPLMVEFSLERREQAGWRRQGQSGRPLQIPPGVYSLNWPANSGAGPGQPPKTVAVQSSGQTRLWVGGRGKLALRAQDAQGKVLHWHLSVANLDTGKLEAKEKRLPFHLELNAGYYMIKSLSPPLSWSLELGAGRQVDLLTGPKAQLTLGLPGAGGALRVPYQVLDQLGQRPAGTGYTGSPLHLLPGAYALTVQTAPPLRRQVQLLPGQRLDLELPQVGAIKVGRDRGGLSQPFEVRGLDGDPLLSGVSERPLPALPGRYLLRFNPPLPSLEVEVKAGQVSVLAPPEPAGMSVSP